MANHKIANAFLMLICIAGVIWQSTLIIQDYFLYISLTSVSYSKEERDSPAVSICHYQSDLIPDNMNISSSSLEDINQYGLKLSDLATSDYENNSRTFFRTYIGDQCIRVQYKAKKLFGNRILRINFNYLPIIKKSTYDEVQTHFKIFIHQKEIYPYESYNAELHFIYGNKTTDVNSFDLAYDLILSYYQEAPFAARCLVYKNLNLTSRGDCLSKCKQRLFQKDEYGGNPCDTGLIQDKFIRKLKGEQLVKDQCLKVEENCIYQCTDNCTTNSMFPILNDRWPNTFGRSKIQVFDTRPQVIVKSEPALSLSSLIIYIASIIGIWTELNVYTASKNLIDIYLYVKNRNIKKSSVQPATINNSQQIFTNHLCLHRLKPIEDKLKDYDTRFEKLVQDMEAIKINISKIREVVEVLVDNLNH